VLLVRARTVDETAVEALATSMKIRRATARCLVGRGVTDATSAQSFVDPRLAALRPPAGLAGLERAVSRIADAVIAGHRIGVFGDYDVDGVTTAALITSFLRDSGATVISAVARRDAGYGFTVMAANDFAERGAQLIITGDCGTSDQESINAARARGIDVVVIDHHTVPAADTPHPAYALVNPFRQDSTFPFRGMASVGLMFYLAAALRTELRARDWYAARQAPDVRELLDLVALGTIADLVPLTHENRILTSLGLKKLSARTRPGIAALLQQAHFEHANVDAACVGWKLGPRLNAPGRLGAAEPALQVLLATEATAQAQAEICEALNLERRAIQGKVVDEAVAQLEQLWADTGVPPAIVIAGQGWAPGVVGIVASKLVDKYQRPAFVIGVDPETGLGRGSARTVAGIDLYKTLCGSAPHLGRFGGHAAAAGFTVDTTIAGSVDALRASLVDTVGKAAPHFLPLEFAKGSGPVAAPPMREADAEVTMAEVDERLAHELAALGPFGQANPTPLLVARGAKVTNVRRVGQGDAHLKLVLEVEGESLGRHAIGFKLGDRQVEVGQRVDLAFAATISTFQGRRSAELELSDLAPAR